MLVRSRSSCYFIMQEYSESTPTIINSIRVSSFSTAESGPLCRIFLFVMLAALCRRRRRRHPRPIIVICKGRKWMTRRGKGRRTHHFAICLCSFLFSYFPCARDEDDAIGCVCITATDRFQHQRLIVVVRRLFSFLRQLVSLRLARPIVRLHHRVEIVQKTCGAR